MTTLIQCWKCIDLQKFNIFGHPRTIVVYVLTALISVLLVQFFRYFGKILGRVKFTRICI